MGKLDGKVGLVTGAARGLGRACAQILAREGAKVVVADLVREGGEETVRLINNAGGEALFDSRVIVEYLDTLSPVGKLIPAMGRERAEVKTWEALADGVVELGELRLVPARDPGDHEIACGFDMSASPAPKAPAAK